MTDTALSVRSVLPLLLMLLSPLAACVSVTVQPLKRPKASVAAAPMLVLVNQGGYDLVAARELETALAAELEQAGVEARTLLVTSDTLKEQTGIEQARAEARTVLRIMPIAGTRLDGVATRITYDASLHERANDARIWQARIEVRSGILARQLRRRQQRAARKLVAQMREDRAL